MNGAHSRFASAPVPPDRVANVISRSLEEALPQQCADRHSVDVTVTRPDEKMPVAMQVECGDLFEMTVRVSAEHVGGNVYDVHCTIEDEASCQLTYSCPEEAAPPLPLCPRLGEISAAFVLDDLERRLGRWHLRNEAG